MASKESIDAVAAEKDVASEVSKVEKEEEKAEQSQNGNADAAAAKETDEKAEVEAEKETKDDAKKETVEDAEKETKEGAAEKETKEGAAEKETKEGAAENETKEGGAEEPQSDLETRVIRQIEYYFGDANLARDKFLQAKVKENEDGWVSLDTLLTFHRLASITHDADAIVNAMIKSNAGLVEISEDKKSLRRNPERPVPELTTEKRKELVARTAYVKGFPLDITMSQLLDYFAPFEKVTNIGMRKYLDKPTKTHKFKGSVFVTFETREQVEKFLAKEELLYENRTLITKFQSDYIDDKNKEYTNKKAEKANKKAGKAEEEKLEFPKRSVLRFSGITENAGVTRELLREAVGKVEGEWDIAFIDFTIGKLEGHIRFHKENQAVEVLEKLTDKKLVIKDVSLECNVLTDEEETKYLESAAQEVTAKREQMRLRSGGRKRRGGGGGGRGGNGGGGGNRQKRHK